MTKKEVAIKVGLAIHKIVMPMPEAELERIKPYIKEIEEGVMELMKEEKDG